VRGGLTGLIVAAALVAGAGSAPAADIYVNNVLGNDRSDGRRPEPGEFGPVRSIARALQLAQGGDRIVLADTGQPYRESISLVGSRHSGAGGRPFVLDGNGAVLDGSVPVPPEAWRHYRGQVFRFQPPGKAFQQLLLGTVPALRAPADHRASEPPPLAPLEWCLYRGDVYFAVQPGKLPDQYPLGYAHYPTGITLFHIDQVVIQDLVVQHFQIDGISAFNSARRVSLVRVTARGNGRSGVAIGGASLAAVDHCLLGNNGEAQLLTLPYSETYVYQGELLGNTAPGWVDAGGKAWFDGVLRSGGLKQYPSVRDRAPKG